MSTAVRIRWAWLLRYLWMLNGPAPAVSFCSEASERTAEEQALNSGGMHSGGYG